MKSLIQIIPLIILSQIAWGQSSYERPLIISHVGKISALLNKSFDKDELVTACQGEFTAKWVAKLGLDTLPFDEEISELMAKITELSARSGQIKAAYAQGAQDVFGKMKQLSDFNIPQDLTIENADSHINDFRKGYAACSQNADLKIIYAALDGRYNKSQQKFQVRLYDPQGNLRVENLTIQELRARYRQGYTLTKSN